MNKRAIPKVDVKQYAGQGTIHARPDTTEMIVEVHYCTGFLSQQETLRFMAQLFSGGAAMWGPEFREKVALMVEQL